MTFTPSDLRRYIHGLRGEHEAQVLALEKFTEAWESRDAEREATAYRRGQEDMRERAGMYFRNIGPSQAWIYKAIAALSIKEQPA